MYFQFILRISSIRNTCLTTVIITVNPASLHSYYYILLFTMAALEIDGIYVEAANDIRKGGYMVMNNGKSPCKVIEISKSKPGKFLLLFLPISRN